MANDISFIDEASSVSDEVYNVPERKGYRAFVLNASNVHKVFEKISGGKAYRKRPVIVRASQWVKLGDHIAVTDGPVQQKSCDNCKYFAAYKHGQIDTLEGRLVVCPYDYIIRGVKGEYYACKPDIFKMTYEAVGASLSRTRLKSRSWNHGYRAGANKAFWMGLITGISITLSPSIVFAAYILWWS